VALALLLPRREAAPPSSGARAAAAIYVAASAVMLLVVFRTQPQLLAWVLAVTAAGAVFHAGGWLRRRSSNRP
jgi:hypothetical protein